MEIINNPNMPAAGGHYSHCIKHNGILYLSGQLPIHRGTKEIPVSIEDQTDLVLQNVEEVLIAAGSSRNKVLQARVYITHIDYWAKVNERYALFFGEHKPTRCIIPTRDLHYGCLIEVEVTAIEK